MKTTLLLEKLGGQPTAPRQRRTPVVRFATLSTRSDRRLFQTHATILQACLDEAGGSLTTLRHVVRRQQPP